MIAPDYKILLLQEKIQKQLKAFEAKIATVEAQKGDKGDSGKDGRDGKDGKDGQPGKMGKVGKDGRDGKDGKDGKDGISVVDVSLDIDGGLLVKLSDGTELDAGKLEGGSGEGEMQIRSTSVVREAAKYIPQTEQTKRYYDNAFISGINIIGVSFNGNSTIEIPETLATTKLIKVKDETGNNNTITITTWS